MRSLVLVIVASVGVAGCDGVENGRGARKVNAVNVTDASSEASPRTVLLEGDGFTIYSTGLDDLEFEGVPATVHSLQRRPQGREPELNNGRWVVLVYHPGSVPDTACIGEAVRAAKRLGDDVNFGVRPYLDESEHKTWCSDCIDPLDPSTPIWVILDDGQAVASYRGVADAREIVEFVEKSMSLRDVPPNLE